MMSIRTSILGGVTLSGEDARKFVNQVRYGRPSKAAIQAFKNSKGMAAELREKGYVTMPKKKKAA